MTPTATPTDTPTPLPCLLDVDDSGDVSASTDSVYITRYLLGLVPVPQSFRDSDSGDPPIPSDAIIAANIDAIGASLDVDMDGSVSASTDVVYVARLGLGLSPVPQGFRDLDPDILPDEDIEANIAALCP